MSLTDEQAKHFYDLWIPLLGFVNQEYSLFPSLYGMRTPRGLPKQDVWEIAKKLWDNSQLIDEYITRQEHELSEIDKSIVQSWKNHICGEFIVDRHLHKGSVLISVEDEQVYVVKGIYSTWSELLDGMPMPQIVQATLIPFQDVITHDGIVIPHNVTLGKNMSDKCKTIYKNAKENGTLHFSLP